MSGQEKILNRRNYTDRTISTYQVVAAYIVNLYYNDLYCEAKKMKNSGKTSSLTEGYRNSVFIFINTIDYKSRKHYKPVYYNKLLHDLTQYFTEYTSFETLTVSDCIDKVTKEFIPEHFYRSLSKDDKRKFLRIILTDSIKNFSRFVVSSDSLKLIIDNHEERENPRLFVEKMVDLLILQRDIFYHKFLDSSIGNTNSDTIDRNLALKMQNEIKRLTQENNELKNIIKTIQEESQNKTEGACQVVNAYRALQKKYRGLKSELDAAQQTIHDLENRPVVIEKPQSNDKQEILDMIDSLGEEPELVEKTPPPSPKQSPVVQTDIGNSLSMEDMY